MAGSSGRAGVEVGAVAERVLGLGECAAHGGDGGVAGVGEGVGGEAPEVGEAAVAEDDAAFVVGDEDAVERGVGLGLEEGAAELELGGALADADLELVVGGLEGDAGGR